jgi:hypothetical protein
MGKEKSSIRLVLKESPLNDDDRGGASGDGCGASGGGMGL